MSFREFREMEFQKDICRELMSIRKNLEIIAKALQPPENPPKKDRIEYDDLVQPGRLQCNTTKEIVKPSWPDPYHVIAVDFDGTLVTDEWPGIGAPIWETIDYVKARQAEGSKIILWTNRVGAELDAAVRWCEGNGLIFDAVNENLPEMIELFGADSRKIYADEFIDDRSKPKLPEIDF